MTENAQPRQRSEPGQPQEPAAKPAEAELSDEDLDQVAGGSVSTSGSGGDDRLTENVTLNF